MRREGPHARGAINDPYDQEGEYYDEENDADGRVKS